MNTIAVDNKRGGPPVTDVNEREKADDLQNAQHMPYFKGKKPLFVWFISFFFKKGREEIFSILISNRV